MSCNPSLHAWTLFFRRWMHSVYDTVRSACRLVIDLWVPPCLGLL
jgi:hypothetical protein